MTFTKNASLGSSRQGVPFKSEIVVCQKEGMMTEQEMVKFVKDYVKAINSHDLKLIEQSHAPDSVAVSAGDPSKTLD